MAESKISIERVGMERADEIFPPVLELLRELGAEAEDLGALDRERILRSWSADPDRALAIVARDPNGSLLGVLTLCEAFAIYANGSYGIIDEMYVVSKARSAGVGAALLEAALDVARERRWSRLDVTAPESADPAGAWHFYESHGFTFAGPKLKLLL